MLPGQHYAHVVSFLLAAPPGGVAPGLSAGEEAEARRVPQQGTWPLPTQNPTQAVRDDRRL